MLASKRNGTLYVGVTSDLVTRVWQHREGVVPGFTRDYGVKTLVWFEEHGRIEGAIQREHNIKHWSRRWKIELIEAANPDWRDLWDDITSQWRGKMGPRVKPGDDGGWGNRVLTPRGFRSAGAWWGGRRVGWG
jgi:putative endonuclease